VVRHDREAEREAPQALALAQAGHQVDLGLVDARQVAHQVEVGAALGDELHGGLLLVLARALVLVAEERALVGQEEGLAEALAAGHEVLVRAVEEVADDGIFEGEVLEDADVDLVGVGRPAVRGVDPGVGAATGAGGGGLAELLERVEQVAGAGEAVVAVPLGRAGEPRVEAGGDAGEPRGGDGGAVTDLVDQLEQGVAAERAAAGQALVGDHGDRPQVGAVVDALGVGDLLGAHVADGAEGGADVGERVAGVDAVELDDAEVEDLGLRAVVAVGQEDVAGLEVAVDDLQAVGPADRAADAGEHSDGLVERERAAGEPLGEVLAVEQLHREVGDAGRGVDVEVEDLHDVGPAHAGGGLGLAHEAGARGVGLDDRGVHELERDGLAEAQVGGPPHAAHAAALQKFVEAPALADDVAVAEAGLRGARAGGRDRVVGSLAAVVGHPGRQ
jgi:hypothetical protein